MSLLQDENVIRTCLKASNDPINKKTSSLISYFFHMFYVHWTEVINGHLIFLRLYRKEKLPSYKLKIIKKQGFVETLQNMTFQNDR